MLRLLTVLLVLCSPAHSEEGGQGEFKGNAETAHTDNQHGGTPQQITVPANSPAPTIINIVAGKHAGGEGLCAKPENWKEWPAFAWCKTDNWLDAERTIAVFTVILAISTTLLWWATRKLYLAGERQMELIEASTLSQSLGMQASIAVTERAANAAKESADTAKIQAEVARDTLLAMKETAQRQLRAYLVVEADTIEDFEAGKVTNCHFWIRNVGQTPPHAVIMATGVEIVPRSGIPTFSAPSSAVLRAEPNARNAHFATQITTKKAATRTFSQNEIDDVLADRSRVCLGGRVYYKDVFGDEWHTDFLYVYSGPETRTMIPEQYQTGNQAT